jgi:hypothetical protein
MRGAWYSCKKEDMVKAAPFIDDDIHAVLSHVQDEWDSIILTHGKA